MFEVLVKLLRLYDALVCFLFFSSWNFREIEKNAQILFLEKETDRERGGKKDEHEKRNGNEI